MACGSGMTASSTPTRISPPAMPKTPDSSAVKIISRDRLAASRAVMAAAPGRGTGTMGARNAHFKYMISCLTISPEYVRTTMVGGSFAVNS